MKKLFVLLLCLFLLTACGKKESDEPENTGSDGSEEKTGQTSDPTDAGYELIEGITYAQFDELMKSLKLNAHVLPFYIDERLDDFYTRTVVRDIRLGKKKTGDIAMESSPNYKLVMDALEIEVDGAARRETPLLISISGFTFDENGTISIDKYNSAPYYMHGVESVDEKIQDERAYDFITVEWADPDAEYLK